MSNKILLRLLLDISMLFISLLASAQITTSSISGFIADESGPVAGVSVTVIHEPSGSLFCTVSDKTGNYRIYNVRPGGPYTILFESYGHSTEEYHDVFTILGDSYTLNCTLTKDLLRKVEYVSDMFENSGDIKNGVETTLSDRDISSTPTSTSRSLNDILKLTPQTSSTTKGLHIGGMNYRESSMSIGGAVFNNIFGIGQNIPANGSPISIDAIEQINVNLTPFDVRHGGFLGGSINAVVKAGTNKWYASAYNHHSSDKFWGSKVADNDVAKNHQLSNTVGVTLGGPIVKNKLFFFINAEYSIDNIPGSSSSARVTDMDPWGDNLKFNRPTENQLNEIKSFLSRYFDGYNPGQYQNYTIKTPDYRFLARIDWNINRSNNLVLQFSHAHTAISKPPSSSMSPLGNTYSIFHDIDGNELSWNRYSAGRQSSYSIPFESSRYFQNSNFSSIVAELNSKTADDRGNNMFRIAWSYQHEPRSHSGNFFPTVDILDRTDVTGVDNIASFTTFGMDPFTHNNLRDAHAVIATDEFSYSLGRHNILAGLQAEWNGVTNEYLLGGAGWFIYDSWDSFKKDVLSPSKSTGPIAFMITHANLNNPSLHVFHSFNFFQTSAYLQDEIKVANNFNLTAGLRFEVPIYLFPTKNINKDFLNIARKSGTSFYGLSTANVPTPYLSISPRIGFNWDVLGNGNLTIRGGSGLFTGRIPNVWIVSTLGNSNCLQMSQIYGDNNRVFVNGENIHDIHFSSDRVSIIDNLYPNGYKQHELEANTGSTILAKNLHLPMTWKSSLSVDFKLPGGLEGNIDGIYGLNFNEIYATTLGLKRGDDIQLPGEPLPRHSWKSEGITNLGGQTVSGYYINNVSQKGSHLSLTAQLRKEFDFGLKISAAYTFSRTTSVADNSGDLVSDLTNTASINGTNEPVLGFANYVTPHRAIANAVYTISEGPHFATKLSLFYEGYNIGYIGTYSYSRISYLMESVNGTNVAQLIYIPTDQELSTMPFSSEKNKVEFRTFLASDNYTKFHRGQYMERNGAYAPWLNRINVRIAQDLFFNIAGRRQTIEAGIDINNLANLLNSNWGVYKILSSDTILSYVDGKYTFKKPIWSNDNNIVSTWNMLLSIKYFF